MKLCKVILILFGVLWLSVSRIQQTGKIAYLEDHIEYLEEYIEDNGLPTPAMRKN